MREEQGNIGRRGLADQASYIYFYPFHIPDHCYMDLVHMFKLESRRVVFGVEGFTNKHSYEQCGGVAC